MKPWRWCALAVLSFALTNLGLAQADPAADKTADKLEETGRVAYQAGDYAAAKRAFDESYNLAPRHTLGLWTARARVKLNEWVEAAQRLETLLSTPVGSADGKEREAYEQALKERDELRHRMPRIRIRLEGVQQGEAKVQIDGTPVSQEFLVVKKTSAFPHGKALQINPGNHQLVAVSGEQRREVALSIAAGEMRDVNVRFVNADTIRQRNCVDQCRKTCKTNNDCYMECKERCFY